MPGREPVHLYLSRYEEHLNYLRETGQETQGWHELRTNELKDFLKLEHVSLEEKKEKLVTNYSNDGELQQGSHLEIIAKLKDGTIYKLHGYYVKEENDWFPDENPLIHANDTCGFCQSIMKMKKKGETKNTFCMLPLPEKKYIFEKALENR
ncbi:hypothetical protein ACFPU1_14765 [Thalassorhabdus alkalitolerans]|uniref:Chromo domain-containing protein n=1 Tax=Thalassorhabdus alkalitolerans TaxID=2282697 RepID=A0ABW0YQI4_9BACI